MGVVEIETNLGGRLLGSLGAIVEPVGIDESLVMTLSFGFCVLSFYEYLRLVNNRLHVYKKLLV